LSWTRRFAVGLVVTTLSALLASCGSGTDANHQACNKARSASAAYKQGNVKVGNADVADAAQANASDPQLRQLADQAATATRATLPKSPGDRSNISFRGVGSYALLLDRCQQYP
jgi:hypothetical protein